MKKIPAIFYTSLCFGALLLIGACTKNKYFLIVDGYAPIYEKNENLYTISNTTAKNYTGKQGKIYQNNTYSYQIENGLGIHVIDCSDIKNPKKISFINITGVSEMAIKGSILYADNHTDIVAINIQDPRHAIEVDRIKNTYDLVENEAPPHNNIYFECVDPDKGLVVGWELKQLENPKCKTY
jgi:acid phosphatase class B